MSAVPAFLDALLVACRAAPDLQGWQVVDGVPTENTDSPRLMSLGVSAEDLSVESSTGPAGLDSRRERADVACQSRAWSGGSELSQLRVRAFEGLAAVEAVLAADPRVGGTVTRAQVVSSIYQPQRSERGVGAFVEFAIRIDAYRR